MFQILQTEFVQSKMHPPNPNPSDQFSHHHHHHFPPTHQYSSYYSHLRSQNPNPSLFLPLPTIEPQKPPNYSSVGGINPAPPGTDQYLSVCYSHGVGGGGGYEGLPVQPVGLPFAHYETIDGSSDAQNWAVRDVLQQYGTSSLYTTGGMIPQNGTQQLMPAVPTPTIWTNPTIRPPRVPRKKVPKKIKIAQSAWCEVCKIECNTKDVLDQHKLGKKHMKNLDKLKAAAAPIPAPAPASAPAPALVASAVVPNNRVLIGPQENPAKGNSVIGQKKKKAETVEDLEAKRRKVVEGGAAENAVRLCAICNVVCNSEVVFKYHLAGAKHASMMKKTTSTS